MSHDPSSDPSIPTAESLSPPPKKRRNWVMIVGVVMSLGLVGLVICCGVATYLVQNYGSMIFEPQREQLNQMAELRSEVGNIESLSLNVTETVDEGGRNKDFMILDGVSEQGEFQLSLKMSNTGVLEKVFLVKPDGTRQPIDINQQVGSSTVVPAIQRDPASGMNLDASEAVGPDGEPLPLDSTERELRELESALELN